MSNPLCKSSSINKLHSAYIYESRSFLTSISNKLNIELMAEAKRIALISPCGPTVFKTVPSSIRTASKSRYLVFGQTTSTLSDVWRYYITVIFVVNMVGAAGIAPAMFTRWDEFYRFTSSLLKPHAQYCENKRKKLFSVLPLH